MKRMLLVVAGLALAVFLGWRFFLSNSEEKKAKAPPTTPAVSVEVDTVRRIPLQEVQQLTGAIQPSYRYVVSPRVPGRIIEITKRIGDRVAKDEVLARLDDAEYQQSLLQAEADLRIARASLAEIKTQLDLSGQELERIRTLEAKKIASRAELDQAMAEKDAFESRLKLADAVIEQREAALAAARIKVGYAVLIAPRPGFVAERFVDEGGMLAANDPIISVVGLDPAIVRTTIVEKLYSRIHVGQDAEITVDAYPDQRFPGTISRIAPRLQESSRVAEMEIDAPNASLLLKPGMFARVSIVLSEKKSAQVVPTTAVVSRNGAPGVFVVAPGQTIARLVPVQVGIAAPDQTEILSPEIDGLVVTLGQHLLQDGSKVILPGTGEKGGG